MTFDADSSQTPAQHSSVSSGAELARSRSSRKQASVIQTRSVLYVTFVNQDTPLDSLSFVSDLQTFAREQEATVCEFLELI